jgi:ABC-type lipoprotein export system ATPase subunit
MRMLDHHQEALARKYDGGHRIIVGPSGSGKTLILVHTSSFLSSESFRSNFSGRMYKQILNNRHPKIYPQNREDEILLNLNQENNITNCNTKTFS